MIVGNAQETLPLTRTSGTKNLGFGVPIFLKEKVKS